MTGMKPVAETRLDNLELLVKELGTLEKVAEAGGTSSVYLSQLRNRTPDAKTGKLREMGNAMARRLEAGCQKASGWMDQEQHISAPHTARESEPTCAVEITDSEWALLENLRMAPQAEKERLKAEAAAVSEVFREMRREILADLGVVGEANAESVARALKPAPRHENAPAENVRKVVVVPDPAPHPAELVGGPAPRRPGSRYVATDKPSGHPAPPAPATTPQRRINLHRKK